MYAGGGGGGGGVGGSEIIPASQTWPGYKMIGYCQIDRMRSNLDQLQGRIGQGRLVL